MLRVSSETRWLVHACLAMLLGELNEFRREMKRFQGPAHSQGSVSGMTLLSSPSVQSWDPRLHSRGKRVLERGRSAHISLLLPPTHSGGQSDVQGFGPFVCCALGFQRFLGYGAGRPPRRGAEFSVRVRPFWLSLNPSSATHSPGSLGKCASVSSTVIRG